MTPEEFRDQLLQSLMETLKDSLEKRNSTTNPLAYIVHNTQAELLKTQIQWVNSLTIDFGGQK